MWRGRKKTHWCPCAAWVASSKCTLSVNSRCAVVAASVNESEKMDDVFPLLCSAFMLESSGRNSLPRVPSSDLRPRSPRGRTSAGARFLSSTKRFHISRWYEGQTHSRGSAAVRGECSSPTQQQWSDVSRSSAIGWTCLRHYVQKTLRRSWRSFCVQNLVFIVAFCKGGKIINVVS